MKTDRKLDRNSCSWFEVDYNHCNWSQLRAWSVKSENSCSPLIKLSVFILIPGFTFFLNLDLAECVDVDIGIYSHCTSLFRSPPNVISVPPAHILICIFSYPCQVAKCESAPPEFTAWKIWKILCLRLGNSINRLIQIHTFPSSPRKRGADLPDGAETEDQADCLHPRFDATSGKHAEVDSQYPHRTVNVENLYSTFSLLIGLKNIEEETKELHPQHHLSQLIQMLSSVFVGKMTKPAVYL